MNVNQYAEWVENKIITKDKTRLIENVLGIAGEAGEIAEKVKKYLRDDTKITKDDIVKELGDVVFYCQAVANIYGSPLPLKAEVIDAQGDNRLVIDTALLIGSAAKVTNLLPLLISNIEYNPDKEALDGALWDTVFWITQLAGDFDATLQEVIDMNVQKLNDREDRGTIKGSGDDR